MRYLWYNADNRQGEQMQEITEKFKQLNVEELRKRYSYNPETGIILTNTGRVFNTGIATDDCKRFKVTDGTKRINIYAVEFAYALHNGSFIEDQIVPRDLDYSNLKASNLLPLSKDKKKKLDWILTNLRKHLDIRPLDDAYMAGVRFYTQDRKFKNIRCESHESACNIVRRIKLKLYKQLEEIGIDINSKFLYDKGI